MNASQVLAALVCAFILSILGAIGPAVAWPSMVLTSTQVLDTESEGTSSEEEDPDEPGDLETPPVLEEIGDVSSDEGQEVEAGWGYLIPLTGFLVLLAAACWAAIRRARSGSDPPTT